MLRKMVFAVSGENYLIGRFTGTATRPPKISITLGSNDVTHHEAITTHAGFRFNSHVCSAIWGAWFTFKRSPLIAAAPLLR